MNYNLLLVYILANINEEENKIVLKHIDSYNHPFNNFFEEINKLDNEKNNLEIPLYCFLGSKEKIEEIKLKISNILNNEIYNTILEGKFKSLDEIKSKFIKTEYKDNVDKFINIYASHCIKKDNVLYPVYDIYNFSENLSCLYFSFVDEPKYSDEWIDKMRNIIRIFAEKEQPYLLGKQVMIQSFLLEDLKDRKIISFLPQNTEDGWYALLEGGYKLPIDINNIYQLEKINIDDIAIMTQFQINNILIDSCYAYGKLYQPNSLYEEWIHVFMYALATLNINYNKESIKELLNEFFVFIENNICEAIEVPRLIDEEMYIEVFLIRLEQVKKYLSGKEEEGISKNVLFQMRSRYTYLPVMYKIIARLYKKEVDERKEYIEYKKEELYEKLNKIENESNYEKGLALENVADYFMSTIEGLIVSGRRVKYQNQEIDLCIYNLSEDSFLWQLGAVILVECKNTKNKVDTKEIRSMIYLMQFKGVNTYILFAKNGVTKDAMIEINKQLLYQRYIIVIDENGLNKMLEEDIKPIDLLKEKLKELNKIDINLY